MRMRAARVFYSGIRPVFRTQDLLNATPSSRVHRASSEHQSHAVHQAESKRLRAERNEAHSHAMSNGENVWAGERAFCTVLGQAGYRY
jgi:hypothetical protein